MKSVLIVTDVSEPVPRDYSFREELKAREWRTERDVVHALKRLGYQPELFALYDSTDALERRLIEHPPAYVFNLAESLQGDRRFESQIARILEKHGVPYTGASPEILDLCKDKQLTKRLLKVQHIKVPRSIVLARDAGPRKALPAFVFPAIVKPLREEGSDSISQASLVKTEAEAISRARFLHRRGCDALVEEFIDGREIYVSLMGNERSSVFPAREFYALKQPAGKPLFATAKAKWDENYRRRWGIGTKQLENIEPLVEKRILHVSREIGRILNLDGYARLDFRVKADGTPYLLEVNPNPSLARQEDFSLCASAGGLDFETLIEKLLDMARTRARLTKTRARTKEKECA